MRYPYYCAHDRVFNCEEFQGTFTDINGKQVTGIISGAAVSIAAWLTNKSTNEPCYSVKNTSEPKEDNFIAGRYFNATVDPIYGAVVIRMEVNDPESLEELKNHNVACKIDSYGILVRRRPCFLDEYPVTEEEFRRIVTKNYKKFNREDNFYAQSTSYLCKNVEKEYPRVKKPYLCF